MFLLDTNVVSELRKFNHRTMTINEHVRQWLNGVYPEQLYLSVITLFEIRMGISALKNRGDEIQAAHIQYWFERDILPKFVGRILPVSAEIALHCADLHIPHKRPVNDAFIAATAMQHNLILVTRNIKDFQGLNLHLLNPFSPPI